MDLVLATTNKGKVEEFQKLLQQLPVTIKTLADFPYIGDIEENGATFAENAWVGQGEILGSPFFGGGLGFIYSARLAFTLLVTPEKKKTTKLILTSF